MKINPQSYVQAVQKAYQKNAKVKDVAEKKDISADKVEISSRAREIGVAMKALANVPDVREEKVTAIGEQIARGAYKPSGKDIIDKLFEDMKNNAI